MADFRATVNSASWYYDPNLLREVRTSNELFRAGPDPEWTGFGLRLRIAKKLGKFYLFNNGTEPVTIDLTNQTTFTSDQVTVGCKKAVLVEEHYL